MDFAKTNVFFTIFDKKKYSNYADLKKKKIENLLH